MFVERFMSWAETACVEERVDAVEELANHYLENEIDPSDRPATEQVFTLLLDDPSPQVRLRLAQVLAPAANVPRTIVWNLAQDNADIAAEVYALSPHFPAASLVHAVENHRSPIQFAIASRDDLTSDVVLALCRHGDEDAICELLHNECVTLGPRLKHDLAGRLGECTAVRHLLLEDEGLLPETRQMLAKRLAASLFDMTRDNNWGDESRMLRAANDACNRVTLDIAQNTGSQAMAGFVRHLLDSGQLTSALLVRAICCGQALLFEMSIAELSKTSMKRVQSIVDEGRIPAFRSLYKRTGLPASAYPVFAAAIEAWQVCDGPVTVLARVMERLEASGETDADVMALLVRLAAETSREAARDYNRPLLLSAA